MEGPRRCAPSVAELPSIGAQRGRARRRGVTQLLGSPVQPSRNQQADRETPEFRVSTCLFRTQNGQDSSGDPGAGRYPLAAVVDQFR